MPAEATPQPSETHSSLQPIDKVFLPDSTVMSVGRVGLGVQRSKYVCCERERALLPGLTYVA